MTRRLSAAQVAGLALVVILAIYGVAAFVKYVTDDIFDGIFDAPVRFTGPIFATMAVMLLMVIAAVTATIALAARKGGLAKLTGALALLALLVGFVGQIWLISTLSDEDYYYDASYGDTFTSYWPGSNSYMLPFLLLITIAGILCLIGPSSRGAPQPVREAGIHGRTVHQQSGDQQPAPPFAASPIPAGASRVPDVTFYVQVDGAEYGPYTATDVTSFVQEGRVTPDTLIRPAEGYFEPARNVPGLFAG